MSQSVLFWQYIITVSISTVNSVVTHVNISFFLYNFQLYKNLLFQCLHIIWSNIWSPDEVRYYPSLQIHRHHLGLKWPDGDAFLNSRPVVVHVDQFPSDPDASADSWKNLFAALAGLTGCRFSSIRDVQLEAWSVTQHSSSSTVSPPLYNDAHLYWQDKSK